MGIRHPAYNIFKKRFRALLQKTTVKEAAIKTKTSTGSISGWADDNKEIEPSLSSIAKIAEAFQVSPNYLLGYDKKETSQERVQRIMEYTGLNPSALKYLHQNKDDLIKMSVINYFFVDENFLDTYIKYMIANLFSEFEKDERYKLLPKKTTYSSIEHQIYNVVEELSISRNNFTLSTKQNQTFFKSLFTEFYNKEIDLIECLKYINSSPLIEFFKEKDSEKYYTHMHNTENINTLNESEENNYTFQRFIERLKKHFNLSDDISDDVTDDIREMESPKSEIPISINPAVIEFTNKYKALAMLCIKIIEENSDILKQEKIEDDNYIEYLMNAHSDNISIGGYMNFKGYQDNDIPIYTDIDKEQEILETLINYINTTLENQKKKNRHS